MPAPAPPPEARPAKSVAEAIGRRYDGSTDELERMVVAYRPLARRLARRYASRAYAVEDLEQAACEGLIKAIRRFDPARGFAFTTFAVPTILGEIRRHCRDMAWPAHVPRPVQERVRDVRRAADRLAAADGRRPTVSRLAAEVSCAEEEVMEALAAASSLTSAPYDSAAGDGEDGLTVAERVGTLDPGYDTVECLAVIEGALPALTRLEKRVLRLRFGEDLNQLQIAQRLGLSRGQVRRALDAGLGHLRAAAAAATDDLSRAAA